VGAHPDKPFAFVVPFAAGSETDRLAHFLGQEMTKVAKQA
jgi:tripartite-type tricarboxylate transporter receptor subunit TctC